MPAGNFGMCWELPTWNMSVAGLEISFQGADAVSLQLDSLSSVCIRIARGRVTELQQSCNRAATELQQIKWHCIRIARGRVTRDSKKKKSEKLSAGSSVCELTRSTHLNLSK